MLKNKIVVITGGTGSFGNAVTKRLLASQVEEIRIFSRDEKKQHDMRLIYNNPKLKFHIVDVRNKHSIKDVMRGAHYVFHAAALKQVPSCEFYPLEAIQTNVLGAENVLEAATTNKIERIVLLSTDKSVYPINVMGMSKALMEKVMIAKSRIQLPGETVLSATRYGNVVASRGSVIPLFVQQLKEGKPLTITNPLMTRFLMTLEESVDLVLHAFANSQQGDIFVQKAPAATIADIALALKDIFKLDNEVKFIGTRHGEKLYESLISSEEMAKAEDLGAYYRIPADNRDLNYSCFYEQGDIACDNVEDYNSHNTHRLDIAGIKKFLLSLNFIQQELAQELQHA